jgi:galactonate dehydratase
MTLPMDGEVARIIRAIQPLVSFSPHNPGGPIGMLAAMRLAAAIPNFLILEQMEDERALRDQICTIPVRYEAGMFALPTAPGLGADLLLDRLAEHRARPQPIADSSESLWH